MIDTKIIKLASDTKNYGLRRKSTHSALEKNKICGDKISIELTVNKTRINSMRYETESCIYCQASASLLSKIIPTLNITNLKKDIIDLNNFLYHKDFQLPKRYKSFKPLIQKKNKSRYQCVMLPFNALRKALNI